MVTTIAATASALEDALTVVLVLVGSLAAFAAVKRLAFAVAALGVPRPPAAPPSGRTRLCVVVPAHDEEVSIARCVASLTAQSYPTELYEVVVVADNCRDDTAARAGAAGATVLERHDQSARGKGHALRFGFDHVLRADPAPDAVVVVDADSVADRDLLARLVEVFEGGADAVQGEQLLDDGGPGSPDPLRAAAFLLVNRVLPTGRMRLSLPCGLSGGGMLIAARVLRDRPWNAFTSAEDLEYSVVLLLAGVHPRFAPGAVVRSDLAPTARAAAAQQLRWEGGKLHVARTLLPRLLAAAVRERRPLLLEAAFELAVPPLGYLTLAAGGGGAVAAALAAAGVVTWWTTVPFAVALVCVPTYVLVGLHAADAPASTYRALLGTPRLLAHKVTRAHRLFTFDGTSWVRTERASASADDVDLPGG